MRAHCGRAGRDLVPFRDLIVNGEVELGEGRADRRDELFEFVQAGRLARRRIVVHIVGGDHLVCDSEVPRIEEFLKEPPVDGLVRFGGPGGCLLGLVTLAA